MDAAAGAGADAVDADERETGALETRHGSAGNVIPPRLLLQWHITERCNLRCAHCYQDTHTGPELEFPDLLKVLDQFKSLISSWRIQKEPSRVGAHITIAGGEPFTRKDFPQLLSLLSDNRNYFTFAILTNGTLIDPPMARRLRKLEPAFVQVSIDGAASTHERIRGRGTFERAVSGVKNLVRECIRVFISFTAHRDNYREFSDVARLGRRLRVSRVWADRLIPHGSGANLRDGMLSAGETREFLQIMHRERKKAACSWFGKTEIAMHRALQFLPAGGRPYHCTAGETLVTVQANGDLLPCRRMPVKVGNLMETDLAKLYYKSDLFRALRDRDRIAEACRKCFYAGLCRGGLKCLSYAATGDPFQADPGCWRALEENRMAILGAVVP